MEDLKIDHNLSVRNSYGKVIQFIYGEDGYNYSKIESQKLDLLELKFTEIEDKYRFNNDTIWELFLEDETIDEMKKDKSYMEKLRNIIEKYMI